MIKWALISRLVIKQKTHTLYSARQGSGGGEGGQIITASVGCLTQYYKTVR